VSFCSGELPELHAALEVVCEPSVVGIHLLLPARRRPAVALDQNRNRKNEKIDNAKFQNQKVREHKISKLEILERISDSLLPHLTLKAGRNGGRKARLVDLALKHGLARFCAGQHC